MVDTLSAKVVDQEQTAVALELDGRFVQLCTVVKLQLQHVDGQLTTYDYAGALDADPSVVIVSGIVGGGDLLVVVVVVDSDNLTVNLYGVGNEDMTFE